MVVRRLELREETVMRLLVMDRAAFMGVSVLVIQVSFNAFFLFVEEAKADWFFLCYSDQTFVCHVIAIRSCKS